MAVINGVRNAVKAEKALAKAERAVPAFAEDIPKRPPNTVTTATGRSVDISRGYNVRGPDGLKIPFNRDTPLDKAKEWTRNFYRKETDFQISSDDLKLELEPDPNTPTGWGVVEDWKTIRDKGDRKNFLQFADDDENKKVYVKMSYTSPNSKGKGVGAGMYRIMFERAAKKGYKVESDTRMTKDSIAVWRRFKELGYPIKENKIQPFTGRPGWFETNDNKPLFEYDPAQAANAKEKSAMDAALSKAGVRDPVGEIDAKKPHLKVGNEVPKPDDADRLIQGLRRQRGIPPEQRERILDVYNDYKVAEDPAERDQLLDQLRTLLPKEKAE